MINLITYKVFLLVILLSSTTGIVLGQTVVTQEGENQTNIAYNPCNDEKYLILKQKNLDDMSDREYEYFLLKEKECYEFRQSAQLEKRKQSATIVQPKRKQVTKPYRFDMLASYFRVGVDFGGNFIMSYEGEEVSEEPKMGFNGVTEFTFKSDGDLNIGAGMEYQFLRELAGSEKFKFQSFYVLITSRIAPNLIMVGRGGYGLYSGNSEHTEYALAGYLDGGLYYSIGAILVLADNFGIDVSYSVNKGIYPYYETFWIGTDYYKIEEDFEVTYSRINISTVVSF